MSRMVQLNRAYRVFRASFTVAHFATFVSLYYNSVLVSKVYRPKKTFGAGHLISIVHR